MNIRNDIISIINSNTDFFNFFVNSDNFKIFNSIDSQVNSTDINIYNMSFIKLFYWYMHYLNAIISEINNYSINYNSDKIFIDFTYDQFTNIKTFFDLSSNIFGNISNNFNLSIENYNKIVNINTKMNNVIVFVTTLVNNTIITLDDGTTAIYSYNNIATVYTNILFKNLTLNNILFVIPVNYTNIFYINYEYKEIVSFFNTIKINYLTTYQNVLDSIMNNGSFSNNYLSELLQYLNFSFKNYIDQMNWLRINPDYNSTNDIINFITQTIPINFQNYYKYTIINN